MLCEQMADCIVKGVLTPSLRMFGVNLLGSVVVCTRLRRLSGYSLGQEPGCCVASLRMFCSGGWYVDVSLFG